MMLSEPLLARGGVSLWGLVSLIFFSVSGGPFGSEGAVGAGGPFWAILGFLIFPIFWCIPEVLLTAELASAFPGNLGYVSWVGAAFGPYMGFMQWWLTWVSGVTSNAVYPHLFLAYLVSFCVDSPRPLENSISYPRGINRFIDIVSCLICPRHGIPQLQRSPSGRFFLHMISISQVSRLGITLMIFVLGPFVVLVMLRLPNVNTGNFFLGSESFPAVDSSDSGVWALINILFWNLNNW